MARVSARIRARTRAGTCSRGPPRLLLLQPGQAMLGVPVNPPVHSRQRHPGQLADVLTHPALGSPQHDPRPRRHRRRTRPGCWPPPEARRPAHPSTPPAHRPTRRTGTALTTHPDQITETESRHTSASAIDSQNARILAQSSPNSVSGPASMRYPFRTSRGGPTGFPHLQRRRLGAGVGPDHPQLSRRAVRTARACGRGSSSRENPTIITCFGRDIAVVASWPGLSTFRCNWIFG